MDTSGAVVSICTITSTTVVFPAPSTARNVKCVVREIEIGPSGVWGVEFESVV